MSFSRNIPERVLESPNTRSFVDVLDKLQDYKTEQIANVLRVYKPVLCNSSKWLREFLYDCGFSNLQEAYPIAPLQQLLLNVDKIRNLCGSKLGVELLISVATLGEVTIDDSGFLKDGELLMLDDLVKGYVTSDNINTFYYLCGSSDQIIVGTSLVINIESVYFDGLHEIERLAIEEFLTKFIHKYIGFQENCTITWNYSSREDFYYHSQLNTYFQ